MNRLVIDLDRLQENIQQVDTLIQNHGASWTLVTKALCGHAETLKALQLLGVRSMADSRIENLRVIERIVPDFESWYLRLPNLSELDSIIELSDVSLNSELRIIKELNERAGERGKTHRIIIMIELGDLREGILPGNLIEFYMNVFDLENIEVLGIGANVGCLAGAVPSVDQLMQLILYKELIELKFDQKLSVISAGSSAVLPLLLEGRVPKAINHFRIGESVLLGTDLINGKLIEGLRDDVFTLKAEIVEIKEKSLIALGETTSMTPFEVLEENDYSPGQRGYRAIITVGQLDTNIAGLTPVDPRFKIAGASSDVTVVNLGDNDRQLKIGDEIRFRPDYGALVRLMIGKYITKEVRPEIGSFSDHLEPADEVEVPPVISDDMNDITDPKRK